MEALLSQSPSPDELATLFAIQQAITSHLEPPAVLQLIADGAQRLTGSRQAAVFLLQDNSLRLAVVAGMEAPPGLLGYRMPVAGSLIGLAIETGRPVCVQDAQNDPHVQADPRRQALLRQAGA